MNCYDRFGNPITVEQWGLLHQDLDYKRVGSDCVGDYHVSTVWLGLDHGFSETGPPIIFETMVFASEAWDAIGRALA